MQKLIPIVAILSALLTGCPGQMPTNGALPQLDGSALTGVVVDRVGGAVPSATNAPSTLVKRDAAGNFAAGTITATLDGVAAFAPGRGGTTLPSQATLPIPSDADFFFVSGTTTISALGSAAPGKRVTLRFGDTVRVQHSSNLILLGSMDFRTVIGDTMQFIAVTDTIWQETARHTLAKSVVVAVALPLAYELPTSTAAGLPALSYGRVTLSDSLGAATEYRITPAEGGVFTSLRGGTYSVTAGYTATDPHAPNYCDIYLFATANTNQGARAVSSGGTCSPSLSAVVAVPPGGTIRLGAFTSSPALSGQLPTVIDDSTLNQLRIRRIGD